jgi:uncharacterized delta-60 repeat protein/uncharacterized repeat protein (TIGR01451 family)
VGSSYSSIHGIAVQPDGKIVAGGGSSEGFALARYNTDGSLDTTFDGDGKVTTSIGAGVGSGNSLTLQPDGKIVIAGLSGLSIYFSDFALARYNTDGSLDTTFDGDGKVTTTINSSLSEAHSLVLQPDGKIVAAGASGSSFALARYNSDGSLDPTFDDEGTLTTPIGNSASAKAVALQVDGKIVASGTGSLGNPVFATVRYLNPPVPDLRLVKTISSATVKPGQFITYTLTFSNAGSDIVSGVKITDIVPITQTSNWSYSSSGVAITNTGAFPAYVWSVQNLASGQGGIITLAGRIDPNLTTGGILSNTARIGGSNEKFSGNNVGTAIATIQVPSLAFDRPAYSASEGEGLAVITLTLSLVPASEVRVIYTTSNGTAQAGSDYTAFVGLARFITGTMISTFTIPLINDPADEPDESLTLTLSNPQSASLSPANNPASLTILDNDDPPTLSLSDVTATEGSGGTVGAVFTASLSVASGRSISVSYATADETATAPADYTALTTQTLAFAPGVQTRTLTVTVQSDTLDEENETFQVNLANSVNASLAKAQGVGTILDDDPLPELAIGDMTVAETASSVTFTVTLSPASGREVSLNYGTSNGTASDGSDYTGLSPIPLTLPAGSTGTTITVAISDDLFAEGNETFFVNLSSPTHASVSDSQGQATILDDDSAEVLVSPTTLTVSEPGGIETFSLQLTSQPTAPVTITLVSLDPTECSVPAQVSLTPLTWNIGATVTVTAVDEMLADGPQSCTVQTTAASADPVYHNLAVADVSVTVLDNDSPGVNVSPLSVLTTTEAGETANFRVSLNTQPTAPVTLTLSSSDPSEGQVGPASLLFTSATWNLSRTVTITGQDDFIDDGNLGYSVVFAPALSTDPNYADQQPASLSLTNLDDDTAGLLLPVLLTATEGTTVTYQAHLTSQPTVPVTITLTSDGQTAVNPAKLVFAPTQWSQAQTVTVTALAEGVVEGAHTGLISHTVSSPDPIYAGLETRLLTVNLTDQVEVEPDNQIFLPVLLGE